MSDISTPITPEEVRIPTAEDLDEEITTLSTTSNYLYEGWGSKFLQSAFTQTDHTAKIYYPTAGTVGFSSVEIIGLKLQDKEATENGEVNYEEGYDGLNKVTVNVPCGTEAKEITANGIYTPTSPNIGFSQVTVNVSTPVMQAEKHISLASLSVGTEISPDTGYDGMTKIVIDA